MRRSSSKRKDKENGDSGSTQDVVAAIHATSESSVAEAVHATSESSVAAAASAASEAVAAAAAAAEEEQLRTAVGAAVAAGRPRPLLKRAGSAEGTGGGHHQHHPHQQGRAYAPESVRVRGSMALINVGSQFRSLGLSLSTSRLNSLGITAN